MEDSQDLDKVLSALLERRERGVSRVIDSGLVGIWGGFRESIRCSRDTYQESYITEYTSVYEDKLGT